jgi:hypothetical protein
VRLRSGGLQFEVNPDKQFVSKITRAKWTGGMAQAIELLLFKDLSSNPSHIKKKRSNRRGINFKVYYMLEWK